MIKVRNVTAIVTDIEGTTSSLSFVKDVLFPYARANMLDYVFKNQKAVAQYLDEVRKLEGKSSLSTEEVIDVLIRWIDEDRKATPLKALQGMIWESGYRAGAFQAHIYVDALEGLQRWYDEGFDLYVYSSGSIPAQKLLFAHTPYGNLTGIFSGYFDTTTGPKLEAESYRKIAAQIGTPAGSILFLSDNPGEIDAATEAGMQTILIDRDGKEKNSLATFHDIAIQEKAA